MAKYYIFYIILLELLPVQKSMGQSPEAHFDPSGPALQNVIKRYTDSVRENLRLYSGTEFTAAYRSSAGHPFFADADPQEGDIVYDDILYTGVRFSYDLLHDEVLFVTPDKKLNVTLVKQKISRFVIGGRSFIYLEKDASKTNAPAPGFYELAVDGHVSLFVRRKKYLYRSSKDETLAKFMLTTAYIIRKNDTYHEVDSKRSLLAVFKDRRAEISKFLNAGGLSFKKDPQTMIIKTIDYYTQLKN